ncbi:NAD-dependent epimerase/dehydratase family protein [Flammeovirga pacifica]|uniref:Epimerase n=1 Tax=Flammeovirga pacifica TaxID=915059 RepID=A0A1S1Z4K7_FLAPC|nr:NAD-dependent epimerase/dehydratase family protein [Flammeovirga pacifica]OHX68218.1 epimerase [Flammeovirga pacifica]
MKVIITGSTGMVGKGVLLECLEDNRISEILIINRSTLNLDHPKLKEVLIKDFSEVEAIKDQLIGYDAIFYCMGISVVGLSEEEYSKITFGNTKAFADTLHQLNPNMVFNYVSGTGTDETEKGNSMWARVKGKTENMILNKGFKDAYMFRPGAIIPEKGVKSKTNWYNAFYVITQPLFPLLKKSKQITTTSKIGEAMINSLFHPIDMKHLENRLINTLADKV